MSSTDDQVKRPAPAKRPRRHGAACQRCHAHKIKCSGGHPCRGCARSNRTAECVYPGREKKILVLESYLDEIQADRDRLRQQLLQSQSPASPDVAVASPATQPADTHEEDVAQAQVAVPVMEKRRFNTSTSRPVYVGAAACTAFADLLWRHVRKTAGSPFPPAPARQVQLFNDIRLRRQVHAHIELPSHTYATVLAQVVLNFVGNDYHFVKKRSFLQRVDQVYQTYQTYETYETYKPYEPYEPYETSSRPVALPASASADPMFLCRMFVIFALGELYLKRTAQIVDGERTVPGTRFYLQAVSLFEELYEEPSIEYIETLLLMSFYSHALNRKNSAYTYAGMALRLSVSMGLHRNMTYDASTSPEEIENRRRVWWTVYIFDRLCSSKLGHPVMLKDDDIDAPLPSSASLSPEAQDDFVDAAQLVANIQLTQITGTLLDHTYKIHKPHSNTFVRDIHAILTRLKTWDASLAPELRLDHSKSPPYASRSVASLRLHFNQCMILATRPVLLFVFQCYVGIPTARGARDGDADTDTDRNIHVHTSANATGPEPASSLPDSRKQPLPMTIALSEACIYAARATNRLLKRLWIDGNIATFGYFDAHYIFSSTIVLVMSNILNPNSTDRESIGLSLQLLQSMAEDGNMPAQELYERLSFLKQDLDAMCQSHSIGRLGPDKGYVSSSGTFAPHIAPGMRKADSLARSTGCRGTLAQPVSTSTSATTLSQSPSVNPGLSQDENLNPNPGPSQSQGHSPAMDSMAGSPSTFLEGPFLRDFLGQPYSELSPLAFGLTNDAMGISSLAHDMEAFTNLG